MKVERVVLNALANACGLAAKYPRAFGNERLIATSENHESHG
jgi:hypothetical protein